MPQVAVCLWVKRKTPGWCSTRQMTHLTNVKPIDCLPCRGSWAGWQCTPWSGWGVWSRCPPEVWLCMWKVQRWCPDHGSRWPPDSSSCTQFTVGRSEYTIICICSTNLIICIHTWNKYMPFFLTAHLSHFLSQRSKLFFSFEPDQISACAAFRHHTSI